MFAKPLAPASRPRRQSAIERARTVLPVLSEMTDNVLAIYDSATDTQRHTGAMWYYDAHAIACELDDNTERSAGVIAALSPQMSWLSNVGAAYSLYAGVVPDNVLPESVAKAQRIMSGEDPDSVLGGRKVRSFYRNILLPGTPGPVTVDRHALAIALGADPDTARFNPPNPRVLERIGAYTYVASAYRGAARERGIFPHEMQAVTWVAWRALTGADVHDRTPTEVF